MWQNKPIVDTWPGLLTMSIIDLTRQLQTLVRFTLVIVILSLALSTQAAMLDESAENTTWFDEVSNQLDTYGIDLIHNLNHRALARGGIERPRLGMFPDLPAGKYPVTEELLAWEQEFSNGDIGGIAVAVNEPIPGEKIENYSEFHQAWLKSRDPHRVFISFHSADVVHADNLATVLRSRGFSVMVFDQASSAENPGRLFATAGLRMAIDSRAARRYRSSVTEFDYLGERVRRNSNSLFAVGRGENRRLARNEPPVFLKQSLGDEYEASTIEEIIVPGGIALGEVAEFSIELDKLIFADNQLWLDDQNGKRWGLPAVDEVVLKTLFDFVQRSEVIKSDAIVDIDADRRVKISSPFRDTDVGYNLMELDTEPFEFVHGLRVTKSLMIDTSVEFSPKPGTEDLTYNTVYEVRFLSADNMRIAQTRVALEYQYSALNSSIIHSYSWGRDLSRLDEDLDYSGLGNSTAQLASYAAWAALFRKVQREQIPFLEGRYDFMKLDKAGRKTPSRF